jgi:hypothetical protein
VQEGRNDVDSYRVLVRTSKTYVWPRRHVFASPGIGKYRVRLLFTHQYNLTSKATSMNRSDTVHRGRNDIDGYRVLVYALAKFGSFTRYVCCFFCLVDIIH